MFIKRELNPFIEKFFIKASMSLDKKFLSGLIYWQELSGEKEALLIYGGNEDMQVNNCTIKSWKSFM